MYIAGQVSTRVQWMTTKQVMQIYVGLMALFWLLGIIVGAATKNTGGTVFLFYVPYVYAFIFLIILRYKFVSFYEINEGSVETCCTAFWCNACSLCQMARHQYGYKKLLDGDSQLDAMQAYA